MYNNRNYVLWTCLRSKGCSIVNTFSDDAQNAGIVLFKLVYSVGVSLLWLCSCISTDGAEGETRAS